MTKPNKLEIIFLELFLTNSLFLGQGYARMFEITGKDSWISIIFGLIIGIFIIYIFHKMSIKTNHNIIKYIYNNTWLKIIYYPILFLYYLFLFFYPLLLIEALVNSYYLTNTNAYLIIIPFALLSFYMAHKKENIINKYVSFISPIIIVFFLITIIFMSTTLNINYFLPILTTSKASIVYSSLIFAIYSTSPFFLIIDKQVSFKTKILGYIISSIIVLINTVLVTGSLGNYYLKLYSFPEYMAIKKINLFSFLQNLENILYLPSYFYIVTLSSLALTKIESLYQKKNNNNLIIVIISILLISLLFSKNYELYIYLSKIITYLLGSFILLLGPILYLFINKKTRSI